MTTRPRSPLLRYILALLLCAQPALAQSPVLPLLPEADHPDWIAVGRLNVAGFKDRSSCTGTLIAPDTVLTAAHCVTSVDQTAQAPGKAHFVAGWLRGTHVWHSPATSVAVHPGYADATGADKIAADLAVITLAASAPPDLVTPISVTVPFPQAIAGHGIVGYQRTRAGMLSARFDCPVIERRGTLRLLDCPVIPGLSGSPVLSQTAQGWRITAIVIAQSRQGGRARAIAAVPDGWLIAQLHSHLTGTKP